ncbi:MAG: hypothetical protein E7222_07750 [Clostridiales bacterium]|nr:hypothetical protein [Clostridiales bacterium]
MIFRYIFWLFFYSVIGWVYETILCSVNEKRWINRGFLNGPYCPVYGFGAILDLLVLNDVKGIFMLFLLGAVLTCTLEYFTSWVMEELFQTRWWDYSERKFNFNGRICLAGAMVFGIFTVLLIRILHPEVSGLTNYAPHSFLVAFALIMIPIFIIDCSVTIINVLGFNKKLKIVSIKLQLNEIKNQLSQLVEIKMLMRRLNVQERRLLRAFPRVRSILYNDTLQLIKEAFQNVIWKKRKQ